MPPRSEYVQRVATLDLRNWFGDAEFEVCPRCQRTALATAEQAVICVDCRLIAFGAPATDRPLAGAT